MGSEKSGSGDPSVAIQEKHKLQKPKMYKEMTEKMETRRIKKLWINIYDAISSLSSDDINFLRDKAVAIENNNLQLSYNLMQIAHQARPNGLFIKKKLEEYKLNP